MGFNDDGTPIIRFENHHFAQHWAEDSAANQSRFNQHFQYNANTNESTNASIPRSHLQHTVAYHCLSTTPTPIQRLASTQWLENV